MMRAFTFLRLTQEMLQPSYQATWLRFMHRMRNNSVRAAASQTSTSRVSTGLKPLAPILQRCGPRVQTDNAGMAGLSQPASPRHISPSCAACVHSWIRRSLHRNFLLTLQEVHRLSVQVVQ